MILTFTLKWGEGDKTANFYSVQLRIHLTGLLHVQLRQPLAQITNVYNSRENIKLRVTLDGFESYFAEHWKAATLVASKK